MVILKTVLRILVSKRVSQLAVAAIAVALLLSGCADSGRSSAPSATASQSEIESEAPEVIEDYTFYFVGETANGFRLYKEVQQVSVSENELGDDKGLNALTMLVNGQLPPYDGNYVTLWKSGSKVNSLTRSGDVATVDLSLGRLNVGAESEQRAIDQIVWTLTENDPTIKSVLLTVDGQPIESLAGHVDATVPFTRQPDYEVFATVWIDLLDKSDLNGPITIAGTACTFEANVAWELLQGEAVLQSGSTIAGEACPVRSEWKVDLGTLTAGDYVFRAFENSAKDGSLINEDTKSFTIN